MNDTAYRMNFTTHAVPRSGFVMKIIGSPVPGLPCPEAGKYVQYMDFEGMEGFGILHATPDLHRAKVFPSLTEALHYYRIVPKCHPLRSDGQPNRPLTAYTIEYLEVTVGGK